MSRSFPTEATIVTFLKAQGIEEPTENTYEWLADWRRAYWDSLIRTMPSATLAVSIDQDDNKLYNVLGGYYSWNGEIKLFVADTDNDPADNDTHFVFLQPDNTVSSATDGAGWPTTEHMKLAEVVVASDGFITNIVDRRTAIFKLDGGSGATSAGITTGQVMVKHITTAALEALLDTATNDLFAVNKGDIVVKITFYTETAAGGACLVDIGFDVAAEGAGPTLDGFIVDANANAAGQYSTDDDTYDGAYVEFGGKAAAADGNVTIDSSTNQSASNFVGGCIMWYIPVNTA